MAHKAKTFPKIIRTYILLSLALTLVFYTLVLNIYMLSGTYLAASFEMEIFGRQYERELALSPDAPLPKSFNITAYSSYEEIPEKLRKHFPKEDSVPGEIVELDLESLEGIDDENVKELELYFLLFPYEMKNGKILYLVQSFHSEDEDSEFFKDMDALALATIPIAGVFIVIFLVIVWFLGRRLSKPSQDLAVWAKNLSSENLKDPVPDFGFRELNDVASELHGSLIRVDKFVAREREFLRQASHELRTPVTVVSGSTELLQKYDMPPAQGRIVSRINRAANNMKQLIETLLWLGREIDTDLTAEDVDVVELITETLEELTYLTNKDGVECQLALDAETYVVRASKIPLYIVVSNLMRNAFQHTPQGRIDVALKDGRFSIENHIETAPKHSEQAQGKGVGLNLVSKVCKRCGWTIEFIELPEGGMRVNLDF